ncbi:MAG: hypothetical protein KDH92_12530 [Chloroflexi bacterium]|nr:hypothetical protein [Chloroflexota bacterium]
MFNSASKPRVDRPAEWRSGLAGSVGGILLFEALSGLAIYLLPFSLPSQLTVVVHTGFGLLLIAPFAGYQLRHWRTYRRNSLTHGKLTGYLGLAVTAACIVSGIVVTWQSLFGARIGYAWDLVHLWTTFATIGFVVPHIGLIVWRDRRLQRSEQHAESVRALRAGERRYGQLLALGCGSGLVLIVLGALAYRPIELANTLPEDYVFAYGEDQPFAPSLARTDTGGAFDARSLAGSESCGSAGCHEAIVAEWQVSAHRWAAMDPGFQKVQTVMATQNGPESTRYCGGCHDPISLFSGTKNVFAEDLTGQHGYQEGVSCLACHAIRETDLKGNANYVVSQPERYLFELHQPGQPAARFLRDFLIRAYPRQHVESLSKRAYKTPEYCAACHKQFIDQEVNQVGWVQLQNQYDNWRKSRWNHPGEPEKTIECRECHMPLADTPDPASGDDADYNRSADDGKHRSHRFLAANQMIPALLELPGAEEQIALTEQWLRGEYPVPEIEDKWAPGPAVSVALELPESVAPGETVKVKAVVTSNKVGHDFPTGPLDIIQSWVELEVRDDAGDLVYQSGAVDEAHFIQQGSFIFKAEGVDQYGNLIDRHNLWEMVGVRFRRSLYPGFSDSAEYSFGCPSSLAEAAADAADALQQDFELPASAAVAGQLHVRARLRYRKFDQFLLNFLFGEDSGATAPITDMSEAEATIDVVPRSSALTR